MVHSSPVLFLHGQLYAHPGAIMKEKEVEYIKNNFKKTRMVDIGQGIHYLQEDHPHGIGMEIVNWYKEL